MLNRTLFFPWELGKDLLLNDPMGPCVNGVIVTNNMPRARIEGLKLGVGYIESLMLDHYIAAMFAWLGLGWEARNLIGIANASILDPHDRSLVGQWLFSGIPHPDDAHKPHNEAEMFFEVIMLDPAQSVPDRAATLESPALPGSFSPFATAKAAA